MTSWVLRWLTLKKTNTKTTQAHAQILQDALLHPTPSYRGAPRFPGCALPDWTKLNVRLMIGVSLMVFAWWILIPTTLDYSFEQIRPPRFISFPEFSRSVLNLWPETCYSPPCGKACSRSEGSETTVRSCPWFFTLPPPGWFYCK